MTVTGNAISMMEDNFNAQDGGWAASFGQTFSVFRLNANTPATGILDDVPLYTGFQSEIDRSASHNIIEDAIYDLVLFDATCDVTNLAFGDVFQEALTGQVYTYVQHRKARKKLWIRTSSLSTITRPRAPGGQLEQEPATGSIPAPGYLTSNNRSEWPLTLNNGAFAFAFGGLAANIPIGIQPSTRMRDAPRNDAAGLMSTALAVGQFIAYVPPIPNEDLQVNDVINDQVTKSRYRVQKFYTSGVTAGIAGYVCVCDRLASKIPNS